MRKTAKELMRNHLRKLCVCLLLCLNFHATHTLADSNAALRPVDATYIVMYGNLKVADVVAQISVGKDSVWSTQVIFKPAHVLGFFASVTDVETIFHLRGNRVKPQSVTYKRRGKTYEGYWFDARPIKALYEGKSLKLFAPNVVGDNISMVMQAMLHSGGARVGHREPYWMASGGEVREFVLVFGGNERLKTDLGELDTRVVEIERRGKKRYRYWFSPAHAYVPVKIARLNDDGSMKSEVFIKTYKPGTRPAS